MGSSMLSSADMAAADNVGICSSLTDVKDRHSFLVMTDIGASSVLVSGYSFVKNRNRLQPPCALVSALGQQGPSFLTRESRMNCCLSWGLQNCFEASESTRALERRTVLANIPN